MVVYIILYTAMAVLGILTALIAKEVKWFAIPKILIFLSLLIFVGLRYEVGADWESYLVWYNAISRKGLEMSVSTLIVRDFGYDFANFFSEKIGAGIYGVNTICGLIFLLGLFSLIDHLLPGGAFFSGLALAYPYLIVVVANGYTRQSAAIGLVYVAYRFFLEGKETLAFVSVLLASLFHKTAIFALLVLLFVKPSKKLLSVVVLSSLLVLINFSSEVSRNVLRFYSSYIEEPVFSSGGVFRLTMNIVPAAIYLYIKKQVNAREQIEKRFLSILAVGTFILGVPSALNFTFADRLLLYLYPVQFAAYPKFVQSNFTGKSICGKILFLVLVLIAYFLALLIWLNFGVHSRAWIPYRNLLQFIF